MRSCVFGRNVTSAPSLNLRRTYALYEVTTTSPSSTAVFAASTFELPSALRTMAAPLRCVTSPTGAAAASAGSSHSSRRTALHADLARPLTLVLLPRPALLCRLLVVLLGLFFFLLFAAEDRLPFTAALRGLHADDYA